MRDMSSSPPTDPPPRPGESKRRRTLQLKGCLREAPNTPTGQCRFHSTDSPLKIQIRFCLAFVPSSQVAFACMCVRWSCQLGSQCFPSAWQPHVCGRFPDKCY